MAEQWSAEGDEVLQQERQREHQAIYQKKAEGVNVWEITPAEVDRDGEAMIQEMNRSRIRSTTRNQKSTRQGENIRTIRTLN